MIILASKSPRRIELMKNIVDEFEIIQPLFDERKIPDSASHLALNEARNKAFSVKNLAKPQDFLISCDTTVVYKDRVFNKPIDENDAFETLKFLSGKTHQVITGYTILHGEKEISREVVSDVTFNVLSDELIRKYIKEVNVLDKAGSYAIQFDEPYHLINKIKGSYTNVIGFPVDEIKEDLRLLGAL